MNAGLWVTNGVVLALVCGACACSVARWAAGRGVGLLHAAAAPRWLAIPLTVVALDLVSYAWHRANHRVPLLWRFHQVHHSDPTFTVTTGLRFHPGELVLSLPLRLAAIAVLGASAEAVVLFEFVFSAANLIEHGDIELPDRVERALGRVLVTPALHRWHHTRLAPHRDTNFATIFSLWDRLFGTRAENDSTTAVDTGLPGVGGLPLARLFVLPIQGSVVARPGAR